MAFTNKSPAPNTYHSGRTNRPSQTPNPNPFTSTHPNPTPRAPRCHQCGVECANCASSPLLPNFVRLAESGNSENRLYEVTDEQAEEFLNGSGRPVSEHEHFDHTVQSADDSVAQEAPLDKKKKRRRNRKKNAQPREPETTEPTATPDTQKEPESTNSTNEPPADKPSEANDSALPSESTTVQSDTNAGQEDKEEDNDDVKVVWSKYVSKRLYIMYNTDRSSMTLAELEQLQEQSDMDEYDHHYTAPERQLWDDESLPRDVIRRLIRFRQHVERDPAEALEKEDDLELDSATDPWNQLKAHLVDLRATAFDCVYKAREELLRQLRAPSRRPKPERRRAFGRIIPAEVWERDNYAAQSSDWDRASQSGWPGETQWTQW